MRTRDARFWAKVDKSGDCWLWTGAKRTGYGRLARTVNGQRRWIQAHRYALELIGRPARDDQEVDHTCHNRACVRPDHLRPVTHKQNAENQKGSYRNSKSGVRGVYWHNRDEKWRATVCHQGRLYQRNFDSLESAAEWSRSLRNELFTHNDQDRVA